MIGQMLQQMQPRLCARKGVDGLNYQAVSTLLSKHRAGLAKVSQMNDGPRGSLFSHIVLDTNTASMQEELRIMDQFLTPLQGSVNKLAQIEKNWLRKFEIIHHQAKANQSGNCLSRSDRQRYLTAFTQYAMAEEMRGKLRQAHFDASHRIAVAMR